ncbi:MAG TPA: hypothetical protein VG407_14100 [Caulobacteraceae bacterium]|nr:hypothetical protein [Caulobacteraceae bacterium]
MTVSAASLGDIGGVLGALLILGAYAGIQFERLDPHGLTALLMNLFGAALVLASLYFKFNLAAAMLEAAWAVIAGIGLIRLALGRERR